VQSGKNYALALGVIGLELSVRVRRSCRHSPQAAALVTHIVTAQEAFLAENVPVAEPGLCSSWVTYIQKKMEDRCLGY